MRSGGLEEPALIKGHLPSREARPHSSALELTVPVRESVSSGSGSLPE